MKDYVKDDPRGITLGQRVARALRSSAFEEEYVITRSGYGATHANLRSTNRGNAEIWIQHSLIIKWLKDTWKRRFKLAN